MQRSETMETILIHKENGLLSLVSFTASALVGAALSGFSVPGAVRVAQLKDGLSVLELFHGDTLAFKDLAMTCTVRFLDYFLQKDKRRATVLVGKKATPTMQCDKTKEKVFLQSFCIWLCIYCTNQLTVSCTAE